MSTELPPSLQSDQHRDSNPETRGAVEKGCGYQLLIGCLWIAGILLVLVLLFFGACFFSLRR